MSVLLYAANSVVTSWMAPNTLLTAGYESQRLRRR